MPTVLVSLLVTTLALAAPVTAHHVDHCTTDFDALQCGDYLEHAAEDVVDLVFAVYDDTICAIIELLGGTCPVIPRP